MLITNLSLNLLLLVGLILSQATLAAETVTVLDRGEPYPSLVAESGVFWVGRSRENFNANYHLEVYSPNGHMIDSIRLTHSLSSIKKTGNSSIVITGINPTTHLTEYTFARLDKDRIRIKTTGINVEGFINFWIGSIGTLHYFADMGGNPNDNNQNPNLPAQTIFSSAGSNPSYLSARVRMPLAGEINQGKLIIVSSEGMGLSSGSIIEVDSKTSSTRTLISSKTAQFRGLEIIPGTNDIVTIAAGENKLVILDRSSGEIRRTFPTIGYSRAFNLVGHCAIVGNDETNTVEVFDLKSKDDKAMMSEKIDLPANEFHGITQIATDESTGTIFARSNFPCNPLIEVCDQDFNRVVSLGPVFATKTQNLCK